MTRPLILIPARYQSSRFPGKPLAKINGKSMISYVISNCEKTGYDFAVVTDDKYIEEEVQSNNARCIRVNDDVTTGSERIALAFQRNFDEEYDLIINVQGDEPLLSSGEIKNFVTFHTDNLHFDCVTMIKERSLTEDSFQNPNVVKAVYSEVNQQCLYFSRASLPYHVAQEDHHRWYQHVGVYSYKKEVLLELFKKPHCMLEQTEKLEQLRLLSYGYTMGGIKTDIELIGVDSPEDIKKVEGALSVEKK